MSKLLWYINRLKAMSPKEIIWRINQKIVMILEKKYERNHTRIIDSKIYKRLYNYSYKNFKTNFISRSDHSASSTNFNVQEKIFNKFSFVNEGELINWMAGFNTSNQWPTKFAYSLNYKQNDKIGCARINWELNRHYYFTQLAKSYYLTKDDKYKEKLVADFYDWNEKNPFLIGISWTSVMEVAIRAYSWLWTLGLIKESNIEISGHICDDLTIGILNQIEYVTKHYSRYSSANNHLIVEMAVTGIVGVSFNNVKWIELAINVLEKELPLQTHLDGTNKEQSIHYHTFVMEAVALLITVLRRNEIQYPKVLDETLEKMCEVVANLKDANDQIADIGDSDEGKLLNLIGYDYNHYTYVLQLGSILFEKEYTDMNKINENIFFIFEKEEIYRQREKYDSSKSISFKDGGITVLKYKDNTCERIMTVDHGPLGFGSIAAHGHADALSITLSVNGEKFIVDPGTYIYHIELPWRDYFRKTVNHSTVMINNKDQSEMKGAFLWGKRANSICEKFHSSELEDKFSAKHDGYKPIIHTRNIQYIKPDIFVIKDNLEGENYEWTLTFVIDNDIKVSKLNNQIELQGKQSKVFLYINSENYSVEEEWQSIIYGSKTQTKAIRVRGREKSAKEIVSIISINRPIGVKTENSSTEVYINNTIIDV